MHVFLGKKSSCSSKTFSLLTNPYTVRPWDARFLGNRKNSAAQKPFLFSQTLIHACIQYLSKGLTPLISELQYRLQATRTGHAKTWFLIGFKIIRDTWIQVWNDTKTFSLLKPFLYMLAKNLAKTLPINQISFELIWWLQ